MGSGLRRYRVRQSGRRCRGTAALRGGWSLLGTALTNDGAAQQEIADGPGLAITPRHRRCLVRLDVIVRIPCTGRRGGRRARDLGGSEVGRPCDSLPDLASLARVIPGSRIGGRATPGARTRRAARPAGPARIRRRAGRTGRAPSRAGRRVRDRARCAESEPRAGGRVRGPPRDLRGARRGPRAGAAPPRPRERLRSRSSPLEAENRPGSRGPER